jgi:DNA polymerase-3 subunit alpha
MNEREEIYNLCKIRAKELGLWEPEYQDRLDYELQIISDKGFEDYFLIFRDIIQFAKRERILVGPGRGSAAGSLVSYLLGITKIDPLKYGLFFERFLNPSRPDLPDIDTDFQSSRREEIFKNIKQTWGEEYTCRISTYSKFHVKQVLRDLCRIHGVPNNVAFKIAKVIPKEVTALAEAEQIPEVQKFFKEYPEIHELAGRLQGSIRQKSVHAAGIVITPTPIWDFMPTEMIKGQLCSAFDMNTIDQLGLLKLDILGLKTLDVIAKALDLIGAWEEILPTEFEDEKVYDIFKEGRTLGVFQFESSLLTGLSQSLQISDFRTLYAATTIARPGPLHSGETAHYKKRHAGEEPTSYLHEKMKPITSETYGLLLFQEQTMQTSKEVAGFADVEAENLRKVISKSKGFEVIDKYKKMFVEGAMNLDVSEAVANQIWDIIRESGAYSFNKAHAVSYSAISYWCAWLKTYYPKEFLVALMNYERREMQEKAVRELREIGEQVLPPSINKSQEGVSIADDGRIYMGIRDVEGVGDKATEEVIKNAPYTSFDDFISRVQRRRCNAKVVKNLIQAGAFDEFGRRDRLYYSFSKETYEEWDIQEMMQRQAMVLDMPAEKPLIDFFENKFEQHIQITPLRDIDITYGNEEIYVRGVISDFSVKNSTSSVCFSNIDKMAFFNIDDGTGKSECFIAPEQLKIFGHMLGDVEAVIIKAHTIPERDTLYVDGVISLTHDDWNVDTFMKYVRGREKELENINTDSRKNIVTSVTYRISKGGAGSPYARLELKDFSGDALAFSVDEDVIIPGEIIIWNSNQEPFVNIEERIK